MDEQTYRQMEKTYRQMNGWTDRHIDKQVD